MRAAEVVRDGLIKNGEARLAFTDNLDHILLALLAMAISLSA